MTTVLVDDLRDFRDGRPTVVLRTSAEALAHLERTGDPGSPVVDELWLDHDLGGDDDVKPVLAWLAERAFEQRPYPVRRILVHTQNASVADGMVTGLRRWGYAVQRTDCAALLSAPAE